MSIKNSSSLLEGALGLSKKVDRTFLILSLSFFLILLYFAAMISVNGIKQTNQLQNQAAGIQEFKNLNAKIKANQSLTEIDPELGKHGEALPDYLLDRYGLSSENGPSLSRLIELIRLEAWITWNHSTSEQVMHAQESALLQLQLQRSPLVNEFKKSVLVSNRYERLDRFCDITLKEIEAELKDHRAELRFQIGLRVLVCIIMTIITYFLFIRLKEHFMFHLSALRDRERVLDYKDRSKALLLSSLSEGILEYDLNQRKWITVSGHFQDIFQLSPEDLSIFQVSELSQWIDLFEGVDRGTAQVLLDNVLKNPGVLEARLHVIQPSGNKRLIEVIVASWIQDRTSGILTICHKDITDEILQEKAMAEMSDRMDLALDVAKVGVWDWNVTHSTLTWDDRMFELFETPLDVTPSYSYFCTKIHPDDLQHLEYEIQKAIAVTHKLDTQFRITRKNGDVAHIRAVAQLRQYPNDSSIRMIGLNFDVTDEVKAREALNDAQARQQSSARLASLGEMASGIAHEINNPLGVIIARVALLKPKITKLLNGSSEALIKDLESIENNGYRISKIVKGLRTFSRDGEQDAFEMFRVNQMIEETLSFCTERFRSHGVELVLKNDATCNLEMKGRMIQFSQVILNLLNNAFDAVKDGQAPKVFLETRLEKDVLHIMVHDSGVGVSPEIEEKIMQPFFTTKEVGIGTGLGLSISQAIVRDHQGKLYLDRRVSSSCFHIELPHNHGQSTQVA